MSIETTNLFSKVLKKPATDLSANRLLILSGYASPSMASYHLFQLAKLQSRREIHSPVKIELIVGMGVYNGIFLPEKKGFEEVERTYPNFECRYVVAEGPVHSKVFVWCNGDEPVQAFIGSANYTQNAFKETGQKEIVVSADAPSCKEYFHSIYSLTADIADYRVQKLLDLYIERTQKVRHNIDDFINQSSQLNTAIEVPSETVTISFLRNGVLPTGSSGLNWGQRDGRNGNEGYIRLPAEIAKRDFFPPRKQHFTVQTDDDRFFICVVAGTQQDGRGKQIETPQNNSLLGEYFRSRLKVPSFARVTQAHLESYGRSDVTFTKIDDETYFMDFSV